MLYKNITIIFIFLLIIIIKAPATHAVQVKSYLITEEKEFYGNPHLNTVYFHQNFGIPSDAYKVVLSGTPDGTGEVTIGSEINVSTLYPASPNSFRRTNPCQTYKIKSLDITHLKSDGLENTPLLLQFRSNTCDQWMTVDGQTKEYSKIGPLYAVAFIDDKPVEPFLDLPWDYRSKGMIFDDAATKISSYFDHEFPILSANWLLQEPENASQNILNYLGKHSPEAYSSHDGYDYALISNVKLNDAVLAAAPGIATFHNECSACGNAIHIDHGNGYQTRYYHLQPDNLITNDVNTPASVSIGQQIGKVGLTGNVDGAHIHFMVVHDKNGDGNFEDNIPDGLVDPYGWSSSLHDPWEYFSFEMNGQKKKGSKSFYLWKKRLSSINSTIKSGQSNTYSQGNYTLEFPKDFLKYDTILKSNTVSVSEKSAELQSIGPGIEVQIWDGIETFFTEFTKNFTIRFDLKNIDVSRYDKNSISIYSSVDGVDWKQEETTIDWDTLEAKTSLNHLTQFALMGTKLDSIAPVTSFNISGTTDSAYIFNSPVKISFSAHDEPQENSQGIEYTLYKINDSAWHEFTDPFTVSAVGTYVIYYYSVDKDGNTENTQSITFTIQEPELVQPEIQISYDRSTKKVTFYEITTKTVLDSEQIKTKKKIIDTYTAANKQHNTTLLTLQFHKNDLTAISFHSLQYDENEPVLLEKTKFIVRHKSNKRDTEKLIQIFQQGDEERIRLTYNNIKNTTTIISRHNGKIANKEVIDGFKQLIIETQDQKLQFKIK